MKFTDFVDVFHGCGKIDLPEAEGVAASWHPIKAITGNTNPAACLPFGKYSVGPYSGGYSSGYGINQINSDANLQFLMDHVKLKGFSHFHHSGTGAIGLYYNYAVVTPYFGEKLDFYEISGETARPGYYEVTLDTGICCQLTASPWAACHQYTFPRANGCISIDFSNDGLYDNPVLRGTAEDVTVTAADDRTLLAEATLQGIRWYFVARFLGAGRLDADHVFQVSEAGAVEVRMSVSLLSMEQARAEAELAVQSFEEVVRAADELWEDALSRIQVTCQDETELRLFYSNFYHTLVKPNNWGGGSFLWKDGPFVVDLSTMWDIYKTQLPLILSLYPEISTALVASMNKLGQAVGRLPVSFLLTSSMNVESNQARMLMQYTFYDAWKRGVAADWPAILDTIEADLDATDYGEFERTGAGTRCTYTLDMAEVSNGLAEMALALGRPALAKRFAANTEYWRNAFDESTGLLKENSEYYEGNHWNYSFRPMVHREERMALCGGVTGYTALLDRFFGYTHPEDVSARFEGFNNETDMEAPYAYHDAGRLDRLTEILDLADRCIFRTKSGGTGRGGIPGNNDSGGLSACYLWNCLGIFPVTGQDRMLLSRPKFDRVVLKLANGKTLTITKTGTGCPGAVTFNGKNLPDFRMTVGEFMSGGELRFHCQ